MANSRIIVDDSHPSISYDGTWVSQGVISSTSNEYNGTVHKTVAGGSSVSIPFQGDRIAIFSTLVNLTTGLPQVTLSVDGDTPRGLNATGNITPNARDILWSHCQIFTVTDLGDGTHTATLAVNEASQEHPFYFDFYTIRSAREGSNTTIVDDHDVFVAYTGNWESGGVKKEFNNTNYRSPFTPGGTASLRFNGTAVSVYGFVRDNPAELISASLDSDLSIGTIFSGEPGQNYSWHTRLYHADELTPGVHRLVLTSFNSTPVYLDYFIYDSIGPPLDAHTIDDPNQPGTGPTGPQVSRKTSAGAIAGGVLGGIALGVLLAALFYFYRRRRRKSMQFEPVPALQTMQSASGTGITPFTSTPASTPSPRRRGQRKGEVVPPIAGGSSNSGLIPDRTDDSHGSQITSTGYPPSSDLSTGDNFPSTSRPQPGGLLNPPTTSKQPFTRTEAPLNLGGGVNNPMQQPIASPSINLDSGRVMSPPPAYSDLR
ncbi:hypothetical protein CPB86DRAFT_744143 [Serendipita vermifera]|nr:hypothetical protein CPB86DRAFT_744143 [Serendipita vermifera]